MQEKYKQGPVGFYDRVSPAGQWRCKSSSDVVRLLPAGRFFRCLSDGTAPSARRTYLACFALAGTAAFLAFGLGPLVNGIWKGTALEHWSSKKVFDGLVYSLA